MVFKIGLLKDFAIFISPVFESLLNEVAGFQVYNFIRKTLQNICFSVNIVKYLRAALFLETTATIIKLINYGMEISMSRYLIQNKVALDEPLTYSV